MIAREMDEAEKLVSELGERLARGEIIGGTPYADRCAAAIGRLQYRQATARLLAGELQRHTEHLANFDQAHPEDSTTDVAAALYCASMMLVNFEPVARTVTAWRPIDEAEPVANKSILVKTSDKVPVIGEAWWRTNDHGFLELWWAGTGGIGDYTGDPISECNEPVVAFMDMPGEDTPLVQQDSETSAALRRALTDLRSHAVILLQNSEGCATNHYGGDHEIFGMPGWLVDARAAVERATSALSPPTPTQGESA